MTLNSVMAVILRYFSEFGYSFQAHCVKVHVRYLISWWVLIVTWFWLTCQLFIYITSCCWVYHWLLWLLLLAWCMSGFSKGAVIVNGH